MPVVPATQEAKAGESLELGDRGWSELRLGHCTPVWVTERDSVWKKKKKTVCSLCPSKNAQRFKSLIGKELIIVGTRFLMGSHLHQEKFVSPDHWHLWFWNVKDNSEDGRWKLFRKTKDPSICLARRRQTTIGKMGNSWAYSLKLCCPVWHQQAKCGQLSFN